MTDRSRVAVVRCLSYDPAEVARAVGEGIELLGGYGKILGSRIQILLKPNLLHGDHPDKGSITHPALLRAMANSLAQAGHQVSYGDSPAFHNPRTAARLSGYEAVALETGMRLADFETGEERNFPNGKQNKLFLLALGALEAEAIINLPKMKTHGLTHMTGALKNMFGVIPGLSKSWFHARLSDEESFSRMLIDLNRCLPAAMSVMDAVYGMEGNGPRNGSLVHTGLLLFSTDPVALDATACRIMGIKPEEIYYLAYAERVGLGRAHESGIEVCGVPLEKAKGKRYDVHPPSAVVFSNAPFQKYIKRFLVPRPVITAQRCTRCGQCVRICPVTPKALAARDGQPPRFDYDRCIRCYCCQETCPEGAIRIRVPLPGILFHGRKRRF
jgi:uncharacterized protein (DUF362 family)/NAD-dependent dihydropyrimidine dehydrogenase PreA subunit